MKVGFMSVCFCFFSLDAGFCLLLSLCLHAFLVLVSLSLPEVCGSSQFHSIFVCETSVGLCTCVFFLSDFLLHHIYLSFPRALPKRDIVYSNSSFLERPLGFPRIIL